MEALFIYLIKSGALIGMFYLAYHFLLRKETFFTSNRWFLLSGLFTSVILPLLVYTKIVWVKASPSRFNWSNVPVSVTTPIQNDSFEIDWYLVLGTAYAIGITLFLIKFALDFRSLKKVLKGQPTQKQADFKFIDVAENVAPFSYFDYIVYNSSLYSQSELESILEHEKVHSEQSHTLDVLISRFFCAVFWYNPFVWLYKKAILQNLEFIADSEASKKIADKKAYQITLLKITTQENCVAITNHFYQSLIKKRIVMLNKNQSNKWNSWKYALVVPVLAAFMLYFQVKVVAQEKTGVIPDSKKNYEMLGIIIENDFKDDTFENFSKIIKKEKNIDVKFYAIKRDENNKIIAISISSDNNTGQKTTYEIKGDSPIKAFELSFKKNKLGQNSISIKDVNIDEINNAPRAYATPLSDTEEDNIENEDFVSDIDVPTPPTPPTPPNHPYENLMGAPTPPDFPDVPELPANLNDKKAMKKYEAKMALYEAKMEKLQPKMETFNKEIEQFNKEMESLEPALKIYDKEMAIFDKEMETFNKERAAYDKEMAHFDKKLKKQNIVIEKKIIKSRRKQ